MTEWSASDEQHMRHALGLAALGLNTTDPNPRVGCVLVRGEQVIGEGWHERAGGPHAEVCALQSAGGEARGATAYVSQEPCAAQGRTPPCTAALLKAGVTRVVYAAADPSPEMRDGAAWLRTQGLQVEGGLLAAEARELNIGFFSRHERRSPWIRVKLGASLDGRTALANGESRWITGPQARADGQLFRARSSVVLTGSGTALADDPTLNVRLDGASRQPLRVVLDSRLRVPESARVYGPEAPALVFTASSDQAKREALQKRGVQVEQVPESGTGVDLHAVFARLAALGANEVWVEAGARLTGALFAAQLVDEMVIYLAPCLLGPQAQPLAQLPQLNRLDERLPLRFDSVERIGADLRVILRRATRAD
jgi:diaminohydroxyphosphoribosylaminopyrimidine deaminase / 5-amino-6-(5-phosphoribosylamino)uracil reductase